MSAGLELRGLAAGYHGRPVLAGIDLAAVPPGSVVAVLGANAAGKSTLLKAIAGLVRAEGSVRLNDAELSALPPAERLRRVGYLPQSLPQASSLVVYESLLSALRTGRAELSVPQVEAAIARVLAELGLADLALRRLDELSGGQRQMVGLAQVIARAPSLLLLDEPTSALDLRWQLLLLQSVRTLVQREHAIALIAVHDLNLAMRYCDRVAVLGGGGLIAAGMPAEVLTPPVLHRGWGVEARIERCSLGHPLVLADRPSPEEPPTNLP